LNVVAPFGVSFWSVLQKPVKYTNFKHITLLNCPQFLWIFFCVFVVLHLGCYILFHGFFAKGFKLNTPTHLPKLLYMQADGAVLTCHGLSQSRGIGMAPSHAPNNVNRMHDWKYASVVQSNLKTKQITFEFQNQQKKIRKIGWIYESYFIYYKPVA